MSIYDVKKHLPKFGSPDVELVSLPSHELAEHDEPYDDPVDFELYESLPSCTPLRDDICLVAADDGVARFKFIVYIFRLAMIISFALS